MVPSSDSDSNAVFRASTIDHHSAIPPKETAQVGTDHRSLGFIDNQEISSENLGQIECRVSATTT